MVLPEQVKHSARCCAGLAGVVILLPGILA